MTSVDSREKDAASASAAAADDDDDDDDDDGNRLTCFRIRRLMVRSHGHEYTSESRFPFTSCLSLVQASPARVERSRYKHITQCVSVDNLQ